jgi:serine/threonine protein kinase
MVKKKPTAIRAGYKHGLGDGHVEENKSEQEDNKILQKALQRNNLRSSRAGEIRRHHNVDSGVEIISKNDIITANDDNRPRQHRKYLSSFHAHHGGSHQRTDLMETLPIIVAVVFVLSFLSAYFIRFINDSNPENKIRKSKRRHSMVRRKKHDTWNDDATETEEDLLSPSVRGGPNDVDDTHPPAVYYPYQPLQQHRHRKNSSTSTTNHETIVLPHASAQGSVQNRSYYLNQSGSAVIAGHSITSSPKPPPSNRPGTGISFRISPKPSPRPVINVLPNINSQSQLIQQNQSIFASSSAQEPTQQRVNMNAIVLSTSASSFETLTEERSGIQDIKQIKRNDSNMINDSFDSPDRPYPNSPLVRHATFNRQRSPREPGNNDDTPKLRKHLDIVDKTPRAANGRATIELNPTKQSSVAEQKRLEIHRGLQAPSFGDTEGMEFASPLRSRQEMPIPFVPSLDVTKTEARPPRSVNVDDLHLYQLMESGNVLHWEARVAEESKMIENRVYSDHDNITDRIMATATGSSSESTPDSIPSGDPRKGIKHKRDDLTAMTDAAASLQGDIDFSELQLVEIIGGGGFGQVWKAIWRGTPVAVKVLTGSAQSKSVPRAVLEEFAAEINLLKGMRHPNICLYMGACLEPPNRAIITELAANGSLWDALRLPLTPPYVACDGQTRSGWPDELYQPDSKHGAPPTSTKLIYAVPPRGTWHWILVKRVACGAARGMAYLHSGKPPILHRDLKSANILLDDSYTAKVCDFGLSRLKAQERSMTGNCGTVQWMAPEVLANQAYNEKADVFSYGIIVWELLSRQCPYDGMSPIQCALKVLNNDYRPEIPKWCPPTLQALIRSCVKRDPDERPTFPQILAALDSMP